MELSLYFDTRIIISLLSNVCFFLNVIFVPQSPRVERSESYEAVDYIKQFEEEEEKLREDERRAKEDLERKLREEQRAKEV